MEVCLRNINLSDNLLFNIVPQQFLFQVRSTTTSQSVSLVLNAHIKRIRVNVSNRRKNNLNLHVTNGYNLILVLCINERYTYQWFLIDSSLTLSCTISLLLTILRHLWTKCVTIISDCSMYTLHCVVRTSLITYQLEYILEANLIYSTRSSVLVPSLALCCTFLNAVCVNILTQVDSLIPTYFNSCSSSDSSSSSCIEVIVASYVTIYTTLRIVESQFLPVSISESCEVRSYNIVITCILQCNNSNLVVRQLLDFLTIVACINSNLTIFLLSLSYSKVGACNSTRILLVIRKELILLKILGINLSVRRIQEISSIQLRSISKELSSCSRSISCVVCISINLLQCQWFVLV